MLDAAVQILCALVIACSHSLAGHVRSFGAVPRNVWLSAGGGVSVAYVFLHILPDLQMHQELFTRSTFPGLQLKVHVYILSLGGLLLFYGLESLVKKSKSHLKAWGKWVFWVHIASYGMYNLLISYLIIHRERPGLLSLVFFTIAISFHFLVNDHALWEEHKEVYRDKGKWVLVSAVLAGFVTGYIIEFKPIVISGIFAFVAGSILVNVLKEEIPTERQSRFWAFAAGAAVYSALLLTM